MNFLIVKEFVKFSKKQIISFLMLVCLLATITCVAQFYAQISKYIISDIKNKEENRTIYVSIKERIDLSQVVNSNEIEDITLYITSINVYDEKLGNITISHLPFNLKNKIETISNDNNDNNNNTIIISESLYKTFNNLNNLTLTINNQIINCKVTGYYKNNYENEKNIIYISESIINKINKGKKEYLIKIKNQKDVSPFIKKLHNYNIQASLYNKNYMTELAEYNNLLTIIKFFISISIVLFIFITYIFINNLINEKLLFISILKLLGYKNFKICWNIFAIIFFLITLIFLILNFLMRFVFKIINMIFYTNLIVFSTYNYCILILITIILLFIVFCLIQKIKNKKILSVLYSNINT